LATPAFLMSESEIGMLALISVRAIKKLEKPIQLNLWIFMTSDISNGVLPRLFERSQKWHARNTFELSRKKA